MARARSNKQDRPIDKGAAANLYIFNLHALYPYIRTSVHCVIVEVYTGKERLLRFGYGYILTVTVFYLTVRFGYGFSLSDTVRIRLQKL